MPTYDYRCEQCGQVFEMTTQIRFRDEMECPRCGVRAERLFTPCTAFNATELRDFPMMHDHIDGVPTLYQSRRHFKDRVKEYNDEMLAKGRDNWVCTCPILD